MILALVLNALPLPMPATEFKSIPVSEATMPRKIFMCRSGDDSAGGIVDLRNDERGNYLSFLQTRPTRLEFRAPISRAYEQNLPTSIAGYFSTNNQDGTAMEFQLRRQAGQLIEAWFKLSGTISLTGTCRSVPAPPDSAERGQ